MRLIATRRIRGVIVLLAVAVVSSCAERNARQTPPDGATLADFDQRIKSYAELRDSVDGGAARLKETAKPEELATAEKTLAANLVAARATAKHGDIFTPEIQQRFRYLLNPELKGQRGRNTRGIVMDENPGAFRFKVNQPYPKDEPLGTVPPNILASLPPLPEQIEYRFVDKHLILRDVKANLIIDYIPNAIS
jgi:hypothetical protein